MTATLAERSDVATFPVNRLAQTGGEEGIALEGGGWDQQANQWDRIFRELEDIGNLQDDWDGLGATAPWSPLAESALGLARVLRAGGYGPPSSVAAGPDGTILFNWQNEAGYLDAEVTKPYLVEWMQVAPGQRARHWVTQGFSCLNPGWKSAAPYHATRCWATSAATMRGVDLP